MVTCWLFWKALPLLPPWPLLLRLLWQLLLRLLWQLLLRLLWPWLRLRLLRKLP